MTIKLAPKLCPYPARLMRYTPFSAFKPLNGVTELMSTLKAEKPAMKAGPAIALAVLCGGFGIAFLYWGLSQVWFIFASSSWTQTEGTITMSQFIDNPPRRDDEARIRYIYQVDGETYEGRNVLPGTLAYDDATEEEKVQQYRVGASATIYYDPQNPESSSLEPGTPTRLTYIGLVLGLLFTSGAVYILYSLIRGQPVRL